MRVAHQSPMLADHIGLAARVAQPANFDLVINLEDARSK
jgi:hypothetical protein